MNIKNIISRWKEIKSLINSDEYLLVTANLEDNVEPWRGPIKYEYMNNTSRKLFYVFIQDYIKNNFFKEDEDNTINR